MLSQQAMRKMGMGGKRIKTLTNAIPQEHKNGLRADLLGLAAFCPFDQSNPGDCPLFPLRKMRRQKRLQWLSGLSAEDWGYLVVYHRVCLGLRVGTRLAELHARAPAEGEPRREAGQ